MILAAVIFSSSLKAQPPASFGVVRMDGAFTLSGVMSGGSFVLHGGTVESTLDRIPPFKHETPRTSMHKDTCQWMWM